MTNAIVDQSDAPVLAWRPWNVDALATIHSQSLAGIAIEYDHEPNVRHFIARKEMDRMGRVVHRSDFGGLS